MATPEERMQILKMIEQSTISAAEGAELLRALSRDKGSSTPNEPLKGASNPRWFRVRVTDINTGRNKVNVNIPFGLVSIGMKMGARFAPEGHGINFEEVLTAVQSGQQGKVIDVVDDDIQERIEIFVE